MDWTQLIVLLVALSLIWLDLQRVLWKISNEVYKARTELEFVKGMTGFDAEQARAQNVEIIALLTEIRDGKGKQL